MILATTVSTAGDSVFDADHSLCTLTANRGTPRGFTGLDGRTIPGGTLRFSSLVLFVIIVLGCVVPTKVFGVISKISAVGFIFI